MAHVRGMELRTVPTLVPTVFAQRSISMLTTVYLDCRGTFINVAFLEVQSVALEYFQVYRKYHGGPIGTSNHSESR